MIDGVRFKVCGLTSLVDAEFADRCGADYLGFIFAPQSPRALLLAQYTAMESRLPARRRVAVVVEPSAAELRALTAADFDFFQVHFRTETDPGRIREWSEIAGPDRLWLAPKLPNNINVEPEWVPLAQYFLLDTFHAEKFGGTGVTGDWPKFERHRLAHPQAHWILSGGLNAGNVGEAVARTGAKFVDVNSGVESAPGVKDQEKLKAFVVALHRAQTEKRR